MRTGESEEAQKAMATQRIGVLRSHLVGVLAHLYRAGFLDHLYCMCFCCSTYYMWVLQITSCTASLISILMGH